MITDSETNHLYLSDKLKSRPQFFQSLTTILGKQKANYDLLSFTNDIWVVDFMPIQKEVNEFIQFRYEPDYLQSKKWTETQTDPSLVCESIKINPQRSGINVDGGDVIKGEEWVIFTDKNFKENKGFYKRTLLCELETLFKAKPIIIPKEPYDIIGHADGMVRYYDEQTLLINEYKEAANTQFVTKLRRALTNEGLKTISIPYNSTPNKEIEAHGFYINYLQMENFILLLNMKEDEHAVKHFGQLFPACTIETIDSREISKDGGVLNCVSWNIKKDKSSDQSN